MTMRENGVDYAFATRTTAVTAGTRYDFPAITVAIPDTTSRTFLSCWLEFGFRDNNTTAQSITSILRGIAIDAVAASDVTVTDQITNTGEHQFVHITRDVTAYFNTNFTGASHSVVASITVAVMQIINVSCSLHCEYLYDDAGGTTRIRTVEIPLDSPTAALTATLAQLGTNQVPNLDAFLPEGGKVYRDAYFRIEANEYNPSLTTDFNLEVQLDSATAVAFGNETANLASSTFMRWIWKRFAGGAVDFTTSAVHAFNARSTTATRFGWLTVTLVVTYEYTDTVGSSPTHIASRRIPLSSFEMRTGGATSALNNRQRNTYRIDEPGTITLVQSGVLLYMSNSGNINALTGIRVGSQSYRAFTHYDNLAMCGPAVLCQRIDSGGAGGAMGSIVAGLNTLTVDSYSATSAGTSTFVQNAFNGYAIINYTHDRPTNGAGESARTRRYLAEQFAADATMQTIPAFTPNIPEASYYAGSFAVCAWVSTFGESPAALYMDDWTGGNFSEVAGWTMVSSVELGSFCKISLIPGYRKDASETAGQSIESSVTFRATFSVTLKHVLGFEVWIDYASIAGGSPPVTPGYSRGRVVNI